MKPGVASAGRWLLAGFAVGTGCPGSAAGPDVSVERRHPGRRQLKGYLPVDKDVQLARIAHRQATLPHQTFPMTEADVDQWRRQFQVPDAAELDGGEVPGPPAG